jgi:hypothetical protein
MTEHLGLLYKFIRRHVHWLPFDEAVSELSLAYMKACNDWLRRDPKHWDIELGTFIWTRLRWECATWGVRDCLIRLRPQWLCFNVTEEKLAVWRRCKCIGRLRDVAMVEHELPVEIPADLPACLRLYYFDGLTLRATGKVLGITGEAVRQRIRQALKHLRLNWVYQPRRLAWPRRDTFYDGAWDNLIRAMEDI